MKRVLKESLIGFLVAGGFVLLGNACSSVPSAEGMTRETISQKYQKGEITRNRYLALMADYERLHPEENAAPKNVAVEGAAVIEPEKIVPEKVRVRNQPIMPTGVNDDTYEP